eukprot:Sspe_Gene.106482::Locus_84563_Transcript_2_2_Confidence_0.500_Length_835::g.106482::m.106482/K01669/phrB; deoxyribodipyrimidine photo-lyase
MVDERRCQWISGGEKALKKRDGPVFYWMFRDKRAEDNWALLKAREIAAKLGTGLVVVVLVKPGYMQWGLRHYHFMLQGLKETQAALHKKYIPLVVKASDRPGVDFASLLAKSKASGAVLDFLPLRDKLKWDADVVEASRGLPIVRVDAHNIVPVWEASDKCEYAARTIRPKIMKKLQEFLTPFPDLNPMPKGNMEGAHCGEDLDALLKKVGGTSPPPVDQHFVPGTAAARARLTRFLSKDRLGKFDTLRNDPTHPE